MPTLLVIGAHPDDETFFAGATMAKYVQAGATAAVVCATRGQRGATADLCTVEELPQVREGELRDAMRCIGVEDLTFLDYEDQKLASAPCEEIRRSLVAIIRRVRPDVAITFDPDGANRHADHVAISRFAADALTAAADPRWYPDLGSPHATGRVLWQSAVAVFHLSGRSDLEGCPGIDFIIDTSAVWQKKDAALRSFRTQFPGFKKLFYAEGRERAIFSVEAFRFAWGSKPAKIPARDIFA